MEINIYDLKHDLRNISKIMRVGLVIFHKLLKELRAKKWRKFSLIQIYSHSDNLVDILDYMKRCEVSHYPINMKYNASKINMDSLVLNDSQKKTILLKTLDSNNVTSTFERG